MVLSLMRLFTLMVLLLAPALALAAGGPNPYLVQARVLHQGLDFEKCLKRLDTATHWRGTTVKEFAEIELYQGLCGLGMGHEAEAVGHFEMGVRIDHQLALPPLQSPRVVSLFKQAKEKVLAGVEPPPVEPVPTPVAPAPAPEPVATPPADAPRAVELAPVAAAPEVVSTAPSRQLHLVGPLVLAGVAAASAAVATVFGLQAKSLATQANEAMYQDDALALGSRARTNMMVSNISWGVAGVALVAAVITLFVQN